MTVGKPDTEGFAEFEVENYKVYLFDGARTTPKVIIDAPGFGIFRKLTVSGVLT